MKRSLPRRKWENREGTEAGRARQIWAKATVRLKSWRGKSEPLRAYGNVACGEGQLMNWGRPSDTPTEERFSAEAWRGIRRTPKSHASIEGVGSGA